MKGGKLGGRDQKALEDAERDLARVKKAREALGDRVPVLERDGAGGGGGGERGGSGKRRGRGYGDGRGGYMGLGKRGREGGSSGSETSESVRNIPWPRDTPPPIPPQHHRRQGNTTSTSVSTNANTEPLGTNCRIPSHNRKREGEGEAGGEGGEVVVPDTSLPSKPKPVIAQAKTTYESAPVVRDLRKEATSRFVPSAVRRKIEATKGRGGRLLEEEEVRELEAEGYGGRAGEWSGKGRRVGGSDAAPKMRDGEDREREKRMLEEEEERFRREVEMEVEMGIGCDVEGGGGGDRDGEREEGLRGGGVGVEMEEVSDEGL